MKQIIGWDHAVGEGKVGGGLGVEGSDFSLQVSVKYPIAKVIEPATAALDGLLEKLKAVIPGDWDNAPIDKIKAEYKEQLVKLLSEKEAHPAAQV